MEVMETIRSKGNLQNLIPIAVVVAGGCEPCAEKMVTQALAQGSSWQEVDETLRILADMQKRECVRQALGADTVARMEKPLAAGRGTLERAKPSYVAVGGCGCGEDVNLLSVSAHK
jgi:carboxymuconolactone decarboxylase family protein